MEAGPAVSCDAVTDEEAYGETIPEAFHLQSVDPPVPPRQRKRPSPQDLLRITDHFTNRRPSSSLTFEGDFVYLYELRSSQVQIKISNSETDFSEAETTPPLEAKSKANYDEEGNNVNSMKIQSNTNDQESNFGGDDPYYQPMKVEIRDVLHTKQLSALRLTYTIVALFCMASFFCFSFLVILFLFMDLVSDIGQTGERIGNIEAIFLLGQFLGTLFAIPVFLYGFSSLLTVWGFFIIQTWNGFPFLRTIGTNIDEVVIEWISLFMMIGTPLITLVFNLFRLADNWWETTIFVWYISVFLYFIAFAIVVSYYETEAAYLIVQMNTKSKHDQHVHGSTPQSRKWSEIKHFVSQAVINTQNRMWCGYKQRTQVISYTNERISDSRMLIPSHRLFQRLYTNMTQWNCFSSIFKKVEPPQKLVRLNDFLKNRQFLTQNNWSIEKGLFSGSASPNVVVLNGDAALKRSQIISSVVCNGLCILGLLLVTVGLLRWTGLLPIWTYAVFVFLIGVAFYPRITTTWRFFHAYKKHSSKKKEARSGTRKKRRSTIEKHGASDGIYQSVETYSVTSPTWKLRVFFLVLHFGFFFAFPIVTLIVLENYPVLFLYLVIAIWSAIRYWFDPVNMLQDQVAYDRATWTKNETNIQKWKVRSRISTILLSVTRANGTKAFIMTFLTIIIVLLTLAIGVLGHRSGIKIRAYKNHLGNLTPNGDFVYLPKQNLMYPTCNLMNNVDILNNTKTALIDYTFLSAFVYQDPKTHQRMLDEWFGPGIAKMDSNTTRDFRSESKLPNSDAIYSIVSFPNNSSVVTVRGSHTAWEWLTDFQIWTAVFVMESFLSLLPAGKVFHPILYKILGVMGFVESKRLKEIQLNTQTTGLVKYMKDTAGFDGSAISITGHSLGGGIALITGAQTSIPAIAISGPNNIFSRKTFDPPLDLDTIDTMLFNVIPERDLIPRIDKPGLLNQHIACRAKAKNGYTCHSIGRTLCELMVNCGSDNRPPPCDCAVFYGYEEPQQVSGNQSFSEICGTKRSNDDKKMTMKFED